jgi:acetyl-CoA acetyltransferase
MPIKKDVWESAAIAGVGYSPLSRNSGVPVLDLALEACGGAIADSGIDPKLVDGVLSFSYNNDSVPVQAIATGLGLGDVTWALDSALGGQAPCYLAMAAVQAINAGAAQAILIYRALNGRSGSRVGQARLPGAAADQRYAIGFDAYAQNIALWGRRYLIETGQVPDDLGAVPVAQRTYAVDNPRAMVRKPLSYEEYLAAPPVAEPFRMVDCTIEVDGACAILVTRADIAADLRHPAVTFLSGGYRMGHRSGLDAGDALLWPDLSRNYTNLLADELWGQAGVGPQDVDMAQIYDCFSSSVLINMEGLGLAERGGAIEMIRGGATLRDGRLPVNTNGGLLSEGYLHGMNNLAEAVLQLQGRGAVQTAKRPETCVVTSGAMMDGSALVLATAR